MASIELTCQGSVGSKKGVLIFSYIFLIIKLFLLLYKLKFQNIEI